jgi:hypothetical protein
MVTLIAVYHSGTIKKNKIDSYEFVRIKKMIFLLTKFPTLDNLVSLVREGVGLD